MIYHRAQEDDHVAIEGSSSNAYDLMSLVTAIVEFLKGLKPASSAFLEEFNEDLSALDTAVEPVHSNSSSKSNKASGAKSGEAKSGKAKSSNGSKSMKSSKTTFPSSMPSSTPSALPSSMPSSMPSSSQPTCPVGSDSNSPPAEGTLITVGSVTSGTTVGKPGVPSIPFCDIDQTAPYTSFRVIGTGNTITASTCNDGNTSTGSADYDSKISVFNSCGCEAGNDDVGVPGCGEDSEVGLCVCADFSSQVSFDSIDGEEYTIFIHGFGGAAGSFELSVF